MAAMVVWMKEISSLHVRGDFGWLCESPVHDILRIWMVWLMDQTRTWELPNQALSTIRWRRGIVIGKAD